MGSDDRAGEPGDDESPSRQVTVGRFSVSRTPVTVAQFAEFVQDSDFTTVAEEEGSGFVGSFPNHELVSGASWHHPLGNETVAAVPEAWVTQIAWTDAREFCEWSGTHLLTEAQWERVAPELGLLLVPELGSCWEWCHDYYDPTFHRNEQRVNPVGPHFGTKRVIRGGADRPTARAACLPDFGAADLTFRVRL